MVKLDSVRLSRLFPSSVSQIEKTISEEFTKYDISLMSNKRVSRNMALSVARHSVSLEYGVSYPFFSRSKYDSANLSEIVERRYKSHLNAWDYALETIGKTQRYGDKELNVLAKILEPNQEIHPLKGYRMGSVRISGATHDIPEDVEIPEEIFNLISKVNTIPSPLGKAIYSHFHIARIHPFSDGNGRVARIVQNSLLCGSGKLPINIKVYQRDLYISILDDAVNDYYSGRETYLHTFSEFLVQNLYFELENYKQNHNRRKK